MPESFSTQLERISLRISALDGACCTLGDVLC
jgi:hypothetical protein